MTRLDQLAKPRRKNGEHMSAVIERERQQALELETLSKLSLSSQDRRKSRSMSQLGGRTLSRDGSRSSQDRFKTPSPLLKKHKNTDATKSMTQLLNGHHDKPSPKAGWELGLTLNRQLTGLGLELYASTYLDDAKLGNRF